MNSGSSANDAIRAQGVLFFIVAVIVMGIALLLLLSYLDFLIISAIFAFGLFVLSCGIQSFIRAPLLQEQGQIFGWRRLPFMLGLIPLAYAVIIAFVYAPNKIRIFIVFFLLFVALIISYVRDIFRPKNKTISQKIDKFYGKATEAHTALGVEELPGFKSVATRSISLAERWRLISGLFKYAPWQIIAAIVLAAGLMVVVEFFM